MTQKILKSVRISNPAQLREDILSVLQDTEVTVNMECFHIDPLNGSTNSMYKVQIGEETKTVSWCRSRSAKKIIFRIFGHQSEQFIDREDEVKNMKKLADQGLGANIVAEFENGIAYEFIEGRTIAQHDLLSSEMWPLIARKLAKVHKIPLDKTKNILWSRIKSWIQLAPEFEDYKYGVFKCKKDVQDELLYLKKLLEDCHSPLVFCHLDLNIPNILYDGSDVHFIDVEYAGPTYAAFDIANHFVQFVGIEEDPLDWERWYPDKDYQLNWIRVYLEASSFPFSEAEVEAEYQLVQRFVLCSHLQWGAWNLMQANVSALEFDFVDWASQCFREYARMKAIVLK